MLSFEYAKVDYSLTVLARTRLAPTTVRLLDFVTLPLISHSSTHLMDEEEELDEIMRSLQGLQMDMHQRLPTSSQQSLHQAAHQPPPKSPNGVERRPQRLTGQHVLSSLRHSLQRQPSPDGAPTEGGAEEELNDLLQQLRSMEQEMDSLESGGTKLTKRLSLTGSSPLRLSSVSQPGLTEEWENSRSDHSLDSGLPELDSSSTSADEGPPAALPPIHQEKCAQVAAQLQHLATKAEELQLDKIFIRVFRPDRSTKALLIDRTMRVGQLCDSLTEKNFLAPSVRLSLVEKVFTMKMERVLEDSEFLADTLMSWPENTSNLIFFEERHEKYGLFEHPEHWMPPASQSDSSTHKSLDSSLPARSQAIYAFGGQGEASDEMLSSAGRPDIDLPDYREFLYIKKPGEKTWSRQCCLIRNSCLYAMRKKGGKAAPKNLVKLMDLSDPNIFLYTTTGGWMKNKAPTPCGLALKARHVTDPHSKFVLYMCAINESSMRAWVSMFRLVRMGPKLRLNYHQALDRVGTSSGSEMESSRWLMNSGPRMSTDNTPRLVIDSEMARRMALADLK